MQMYIDKSEFSHPAKSSDCGKFWEDLAIICNKLNGFEVTDQSIRRHIQFMCNYALKLRENRAISMSDRPMNEYDILAEKLLSEREKKKEIENDMNRTEIKRTKQSRKTDTSMIRYRMKTKAKRSATLNDISVQTPIKKNKVMKVNEIKQEECIPTKEECITTKEECIPTKEECITTKEECITTKEECITTKEESVTIKEEDTSDHFETHHDNIFEYLSKIC